MKNIVKGRVWKFASNVDTDQIIPAEYLVSADPKELGSHAFEKVRPEFVGGVREGDVIVAGDNFGCGSSREHAPLALMGCGVSCVIARSFARIYFRNSINLGFPAVECEVEAGEGDVVEVDYAAGVVRNLTSGREFKFKPLPKFLMNLMQSGGLVPYVKKKLNSKTAV